MGVKWINTKYGKAHLFRNNPRTIRQGSFEKLADSLDAFPHFMTAQKIVVWKVPPKLEKGDGERCPFEGQEGSLIVLSGNQRTKILLAEGKTAIPDDWVVEAKGSDGEWWPWRDAEVFLNVANNPEGVAGDFDYGTLQEKFDEFRMAMAGIDFSHFTKALEEGTMGAGVVDEAVGKAETDDLHGEKSEELANFIAEREKTRKDLKEIDEWGFYMTLVFTGGFEEKAEFIGKCGAFGGRVVSPDKSPYLVLCFESYDQKMAFAEAVGLTEEDPETGVPPLMYGLFCDGREFAKRIGVELSETGLHFRDRVLDTHLEELAMEPARQKTEAEIETEIYERLKRERRELGMDARSPGERRKSGENAEE